MLTALQLLSSAKSFLTLYERPEKEECTVATPTTRFVLCRLVCCVHSNPGGIEVIVDVAMRASQS